MKKVSLVLGMVICLGTISFTQSVGLRAGVNISNLLSDSDGNTSIVAWQFGPFINAELNDGVDLNFALLYSKKGSKDELTDITGGLSYLEVPALARFKISPIFIQLGAYGSYLLTAEAGGVDIKESFKDGDYGGIIGAGVILGNVKLDARYARGFADIDEFQGSDIKNGVFTVGIEFGF